LVNNLLDTEYLLTVSVNGQVNVVATAFQSIQVITQTLALYVLELDVRDKDSGTLELETIWDTFTTQDATVRIPADEPAFT
jgi:hypothetical protein